MRRNLWLVLSLVMSLAALVALNSFVQRIENTVLQDSKKFLAADFRIHAFRPFDDKVLESVKNLPGTTEIALRTNFLATLLNSKGEAKSVNVSAIEGRYPFYGKWVTRPALRIEDLNRGELPGILVDEGLDAAGWHVGETVQLGSQKFKVQAVLVDEPQNMATSFAGGARVVIARETAGTTGLLGVGARRFEQLLVKSDQSSSEFRKLFRKQNSDLHLRIITPEKANQQTQNILDRIQSFLSFVLLSGILLGACGIFFILRSRLILDLPQIITLRCLGMTSRDIYWQNFKKFLSLATVSAILSVCLGLAVERFLYQWSERYFQVELNHDWKWLAPLLLSLGVAWIVSAAAVFVPLREILRVPVLAAFRDSSVTTRGLSKIDGFVLAALGLLLSFLVVQGRGLLSLSVFGSFVGMFSGIALLAWLLMGTIDPMTKRFPFSLRQGILAFSRNKVSTLLTSTVLGLAVFFLVTVVFIARNLRAQVTLSDRAGVPNVILLGLVADDLVKVQKLFSESVDFVPTLQGRLTEIAGAPVTDSSGDPAIEEEGGSFLKTREYIFTRRKEILAFGENLVQGDTLFGPPLKDGRVRISAENDFAKRMGLRVGDTLKVELAGVEVLGEIRSLRKVDWFNFRPNFFLVFNEEDVAEAPFGYVGVSRIPNELIAARIQAVVREIPSITVVDGEALGQRILNLLGQLSLVVFSVTAFTGLSGLFVVAGIVMSGIREEVIQVGLWRVLGMNRRDLLMLFFSKHAMIGLFSSVTGILGSILVSALVAKYVIQIPFQGPALGDCIVFSIGLALLTFVLAYVILRGPLKASVSEIFRITENY
jgi:putative ABC transport system permease protein